MPQNTLTEHIPGFEYRATAEVVLEGDANTSFDWMVQSPDGRYGILGVRVPGDNNAWMIENF